MVNGKHQNPNGNFHTGFAVPYTVAAFCRVKPGTSSCDVIQYGGRNRSVVRNCCIKVMLLTKLGRRTNRGTLMTHQQRHCWSKQSTNSALKDLWILRSSHVCYLSGKASWVAKRSKPKGLELVRKSEWNAQFPFGNSVWGFWSTFQEIPFSPENFLWKSQISLPIYIPTEISGKQPRWIVINFQVF